MSRHIAVDQSWAPVLHYHQHIHQSERARYDDEEVARHDGLGVVLQERRPSLIPSRPPGRAFRKILPYRPRGDLQSALQPQLIRNALLAPQGSPPPTVGSAAVTPTESGQDLHLQK